MTSQVHQVKPRAGMSDDEGHDQSIPHISNYILLIHMYIYIYIFRLYIKQMKEKHIPAPNSIARPPCGL